MSDYLIDMTKEQRAAVRSFAVLGSLWLAGVLFSSDYLISAFFAAALWFEHLSLREAFTPDQDSRAVENAARELGR